MKLARKTDIVSNSIKAKANTYVHPLVRGIESFSKYIGFAVSLIGLLVISSWLFGIQRANNVFAELYAMKANTAIAFITAGLSLWLRGNTSAKVQTTARLLGGITALIGLLTLGEYLSGRNFGIDELIFKDLATSGMIYPGRMSFMSALIFTMLGMALLLIDSNNERSYNLAQSLTLVAGMIAYIALVVHLFDVHSLFRVSVFAPGAFHTVLSFILLFVGVICAQPENGWMGNLIANTLGGDLLRRLLPVAFVVPILFGWLRLQGQLAGYYDTALGTTLLVVAITLLLSVIIWFNAKGLTRVDMDQRRAEEELRQSEERFRSIVNQTAAGIVETDLTGKFLTVNERFLEITGYTREELMGGMQMRDITHPDDLPRSLELLQECLKYGTPFEIEKRYIRRDGSFVWINNSVSAIKGADGQPHSFVAIVIDITKRILAEEWEQSSAANLLAAAEANAKFRTFFDQGSYFAGVMALDGTIIEANRLSLEAGGYTRDEVIGKKFWDCGWWNPSPDLMEMVRNGTQYAAEGKLFRQESKYFLADGSERFVDLIIAPVKDDMGRLLFLAPTGTDITERKHTEQALTEFAQQQESLYKLTDQLQRTTSFEDVFNAALDAIFGALHCDRASILLFDDSDVMHFVAWRGLSDDYRKATDGHSPWKPNEKNAEPIGINDIVTGEIDDSLKAIIKGEGIGSLAFIPLVSDGHLIGKFMTYYNAPHIFSAAELDLSLTIANQLAFGIERKRAEEALRENERRFREMIDALPMAIYTTDAEGLLTHFNPAAVEFSGRVPKVGTDRWCVTSKLYHPDGTPLPHDQCPMAIALKDGRVVSGAQAIAERPDGTRIWFEPYPTPLRDSSGRIVGGINMLVDVTERRQVDEALRESEERFRAILRQATAGIVRKDAEGKLMFVNQAFCNMLGYTESELLGKTIWQLTHNDDMEENKRLYDRTMLEGIPFKLEKRLIRQDGLTLWVDVSVSPIMDATGKPQSAVAVEVDITARKQAEEALHQLNLQLENQVQSRTAKLRSVNQSLREEIAERKRVEEQLIYQALLISNVNDAIIATDDNLVVTYWNSTAEQIYGWSAEEVLGRAVSDILQTEFIDGNTHSGALQKVNEFSELRTAVTHLRKDGSRIFVEAHTSTLLNEDGKITGYVSINRDITERKKAEQELRLNRDRLRSLSQRLVEVQEEERRTIANELHDRVGQSLSALNINLTIMRDQLSTEAVQRIGTRMNDSMQLAAEAITLVRDVMSDLRPSVLDDYGLEAALQSYIDQFKSRYGIKILFEKPEQPILRMIPSVEMTFLRIAQESLLNIARHARADQVTLSLGQEGNAVRLIVKDNGNGIESWQDANRPGSHGLTIMRERADAVGGNLRVVSVPGKGTRVEVSIPIENGDLQPVQEERRE